MKGVAVVDIQAPFPRLDHDLVLVDTPAAAHSTSTMTPCCTALFRRPTPSFFW